MASCSNLQKRKRVVVTMEKKLEGLKRINMGESIKNVAQDLGVGETTVGDWKRNKKQIEGYCNSVSKHTLEKRATLKKPKSDALDEAVFLWFKQQRAQGVPISGPILQEKALVFNEKLNGPETFAASKGWLGKFRNRHGIRQLTVTGENADTDAANEFIKSFQDLIEKERLLPEQVYNADETGLYFKMLPSKTLAFQEEQSSPGLKMSKECVTILLCANASGEDKLPLLVIGKSAKPRALKHVNFDHLPVKYANQKAVLMTSQIFEHWFHFDFVPHVKSYLQSKGLPERALLLLDNAPSHPSEDILISGEIKVAFLHPNVTPISQPMDQGVIETLKKYYRKQLLSQILSSENNVIDSLKQITMKDVIYMSAHSWNLVSENTINKSFSKIWPTIKISKKPSSPATEAPSIDELVAIIKEIERCENVTENDVEEWINTETNQVTFRIFSDDEIVRNVMDVNIHQSSDEEEDQIDVTPSISHAEGTAILTKALAYLEQRRDVPFVDLVTVRNWRDRAALDRHSIVTHKKVTDFFKQK